MKPPFGTLNGTLAKTITQNAPKYRRIVEPFGDGGTYALHVGHKPPTEHVVNIADEALFGAMTFAQAASSGDRARLKSLDWVASPETFEKVMAITATEGPDAFYRFLYAKKFGMAMEPDAPPEFDMLKTGEDISHLLYTLPMMRAGLKKATITNEEPLSLLSGGGSDTFWILLPKKPEDAEAVQSRVSGLSGSVFLGFKVADVQGVIDAAKRFGDMVVSPLSVASIMMGTFSVVTNYESKLVAIDPETGGMADMSVRSGRSRRSVVAEERARRSAAARRRLGEAHRPLFADAAARVIRRERADVMKAAERLLRRRGLPEFDQWLEEFYRDDHPQFIEKNMAEVFRAYGKLVQADAAEEIDAAPEMTPETEEFVRAYMAAFVARHTSSSLGQLRQVTREAELLGQDPVEALEQRFDAWEETRSGRIAMRETVQLGNALAKFVWVLAGITLFRWAAYGENCPYCQQLNNKVAGVDKFFVLGGETLQPEGADRPMTVSGNTGHPPLHEGCLTGDSLILARDGILAASKRWFDGDIVTIRTASGHKLSCTPNHPILTQAGWVAAGLLNVGGHVICDGESEWRSVVDRDDQNMPTRIEDVLESFRRSPEVIACPVPVTAEHFHGDGAGSEVAVIWANRLLVNYEDVAGSQHHSECPLVTGNVHSSFLSGQSGKMHLSGRLFSTSGSSIRGGGLSRPFIRGHIGRPDAASIAAAAGGNASLNETPANGCPRHSEFESQGIFGLPATVFADQIVAIERYPFHGYVFNLQTPQEWYVADSIITHNCDCAIVPETSGRGRALGTEERRLALDSALRELQDWRETA